MSKLGLSPYGISYLTNQVRNYFKLEVIQAGHELQRNQAVISLTLNRYGLILNASVKDDQNGARYEVLLDTEVFRLSNCSCGSSSYCKHMAAAFLLVYTIEGMNIDKFIKNFHSTSNETPPSEQLKARIHYPASPTTVATVPSRLSPISEDQSAQQWHERFNASYTTLLASRKKEPLAACEKIINQLSETDRSWNALLSAIYQVHVRLFIVEQLIAWLKSPVPHYNYNYEYEYNARISMYNIIEDLINIANNNDLAKAFEQYPQHALDLAQYVHDLTLSKETALEECHQIYQIIWGHILPLKASPKEELRIKRALLKCNPQSGEHDQLQMALAHFHFLKGEDIEAIERLKTLNNRKLIDHYFIYLNTHVSLQQWDKLLLWITFLPSLMHSHQHYVWNELCKYWISGFEAQPSNVAWHNWVMQHIDKTFEHYERYLVDCKKEEQWVDLHLYVGKFPGYESLHLLDKLSRKKPQLLLPLYHRSIEVEIAKKTREGYRTAVQGLKQLEHHYKKLNQLVKWKRYIAHLTERYSRLRALQEELKKGNIIA